MAEKYYSLSAFGYCAENPVLAIDPDGRVVIPALIIVGKAVVGAGLDAAVDINLNGNVSTVGTGKEDKTIISAGVDMASSIISSLGSKVTSKMKELSYKDITKGSFSTLNKADKAKAYKINEVTHSKAFTEAIENGIETSSTAVGKATNNEIDKKGNSNKY